MLCFFSFSSFPSLIISVSRNSDDKVQIDQSEYENDNNNDDEEAVSFVSGMLLMSLSFNFACCRDF